MKFENEIINTVYNYLLERHSESESNFILTNSLAILGDKKIQVSKTLDKDTVSRINKYKYPERLASFVRISSEKTDSWKKLSFARIACS